MEAFRLKSPIRSFDIGEFGIEKEKFINKLKWTFNDLPHDSYLVRQRHLEILRAIFPFSNDEKIYQEASNSYYRGEIDLETFLGSFCGRKEEVIGLLSQLKPTRFRGSACFIEKEKGINCAPLERIEQGYFSQKKAKNVGPLDYREYPRIFYELSEEIFDNNYFNMIINLTNLAKKNYGIPTQMKVTIHHTKVLTNVDCIGTNSPEGIHQDGMDFIVSAIVVDRYNVNGGISTIYDDDKKTKIFETILMPGQGILQPDYGSSLWHTVSPIISANGMTGHRSTIGIDIEMIQ